MTQSGFTTVGVAESGLLGRMATVVDDLYRKKYDGPMGSSIVAHGGDKGRIRAVGLPVTSTDGEFVILIEIQKDGKNILVQNPIWNTTIDNPPAEYQAFIMT